VAQKLPHRTKFLNKRADIFIREFPNLYMKVRSTILELF